MSSLSPGKLEKMKITAYEKPNYTGQYGQPYSVHLNPEDYSMDYTIDFNRDTGIGSAGTSASFSKVSPEKVSFKFIFDATGVIPGASTDLMGELKKFKDLVYDYNGNIHSPNYLKLSWGAFLFKGRLTNLSIKYVLFKPDGTPIRAEVDTTFEEFADPATTAKEAGKSSPDLTHVRTVRAGDTLPLMCYQIYGDSAYYMEVAESNNLADFRNLKPGDQVYFPPLKDQ